MVLLNLDIEGNSNGSFDVDWVGLGCVVTAARLSPLLPSGGQTDATIRPSVDGPTDLYSKGRVTHSNVTPNSHYFDNFAVTNSELNFKVELIEYGALSF